MVKKKIWKAIKKSFLSRKKVNLTKSILLLDLPPISTTSLQNGKSTAVLSAPLKTGAQAENKDNTNDKNEDDFNDEKVKTFDQEGTPAVISSHASVCDVNFSDEEIGKSNFS